MDKNELIFASHIEDLFAGAREKYVPKFSSFLDERQQELTLNAAHMRGYNNFLLFGGYEDATRRMLGVFPEYDEPDESGFPLVPLSFAFRKQDKLSHRDFLGSLMALMIKREAVGDILAGEGICVIFVTKQVVPIILSDVEKIGKVGVRVTAGMPDVLPQAHQYQDVSVIVSSLRLDCIVAAMLSVSRENAAQKIRAQLVRVNCVTQDNISKILSQGDVVVVKGFGKFVLVQTGSLTKKGRLNLLCKKYV